MKAAERALDTREQAFRAEQLRLVNGLSTPCRLILAQRDLLAAQAAKVQAQANFAKALIAVELATGTLLKKNGISFDDASAEVYGRVRDWTVLAIE